MDTRIIQLLARKLSGEATVGELAELDDLLTRNPEGVYYAELIGQLWDEEKMRGPTDTDIFYLKHIARHRPDFRGLGKLPVRPVIETEEPREMPLESSFAEGRGRRYLLGWIGVAAAVIITLGYFLLHSGAIKTSEAVAGGVVEVEAPKGSRKTLFLPDGTMVRLNGGSSIRYDSNMQQKDARVVTLSGEAYFDVARDKDRGFIVHTDEIAIKVLGTAFNVRAYPQDKMTEATLMHGSIELTVNNKPYQKIILRPREKFALIDDVPEKLIVQDIVPLKVEDKEYVQEVSWVEDEFVFQNETLEELAPRMERWFNVQVRIDNPRIKAFHFTGIFHKETIEQALTVLQFIKPFKFNITDNHVYIHE
ncbi:MAG TPA: FecR domain-containing protein [Puia sp.]|jgi:ferric-dicitrate binding protein FerR (iron transport regulator)|nr:FecR domain-containing protein [Puia sp.]